MQNNSLFKPHFYITAAHLKFLIESNPVYSCLNIDVHEDGKWKIRTNRELEGLNKGENIVKWIKGQRIS
jgi:hypothetical protein